MQFEWLRSTLLPKLQSMPVHVLSHSTLTFITNRVLVAATLAPNIALVVVAPGATSNR